jgi:hypothetical protein
MKGSTGIFHGTSQGGKDRRLRGDTPSARRIAGAFTDGFAFKPATTFGTMNTDVLERTPPGYRRPNFCDLIAANPPGG